MKLQGLTKFKIDASGSNVKSIQNGVLSVATSSETSFDVNISPVGPLKSVVILSCRLVSGSTALDKRYFFFKGSLTSGTVLNITRTLSSTSMSAEVSWQVIEFENTKSIQMGTSTDTATSVSIEITGVVTTKSVLFFSYALGSLGDDYVTNGTVASNTSIVFKSKAAPASRSLQWYVVEFN